MKTLLISVAVLLGVANLSSGCGGDTLDSLTFSAKSQCYKGCDKQVSCMIIQSGSLNGCQLSCDAGSRDTERCSNEDDVWKKIRDTCQKDTSMCTETATVYTTCVATEKAKCMAGG
jgi:hypothetical protein